MFSVFFAILSVVHLVASSPSCRCTPRDPCWPSEGSWSALNHSVDGNLVKVLPVAHVCYHPTYDREKCDEITILDHNSNWRATQPGALQNFNWENLPSRHESCYVNASGYEGGSCDYGRISHFSVIAQNPTHIQKAVDFAREHNIRLVVKNTGHDGSRSAAPDSFQILTNRLKDISFAEHFTPSHGPKELDYGPVVSFGAGVMSSELYEAGAAHGYSIIGAVYPTVGIAGGFFQGGGFSPALSTMGGLGVDQVLEVEVVTAKGDIVIANDFHHKDLFWALRGGGGGTFGIVTRVTARVHPDVPAVIASLHFKMPQMDGSFWSIIQDLTTAVRNLSTDDTGGQYFLGREPDINGASFANLTMFFYPDSLEMPAEAEEVLESFLEKLRAAGIDYTYNVNTFPKISSFLTIPFPFDIGGTGSIQGNVLLSREFTYSQTGLSLMIDKLSKLEYEPGDMIEVNPVGGKVISNGNSIDSALHPGWRRSSLLLIHRRSFLPDFTAQEAAYNYLTNIVMPTLLSIEKKPLAVYLNLADPYQRDFQKLFWGANYRRLLKIKRKWDPYGLFVVRKGVGSEMWDEEGICRVIDVFKEPQFGN